VTAVATGQGAGSRRGLLVGAGLLAVVVLVALVGGSSSGRITGPPLSRRAQGPDGLRGLVLLLESYRATVHEDRTPPSARATVSVVVEDRLEREARAELRRWVEDGHTLVITDVSSPLASGLRGGLRSTVERGVCDLPGVEAASIDLRTSAQADLVDAVRLTVGDGDTSCFGDGSSAFVVAHPLGAGTVVTVGGAQPFVNAALAKADNAALAVALLAPDDGADVAFIEANALGAGRKTLVDLVPDRVIDAVIELVVAFVLYALWRSRRLGRPVPEVQPVAIPASGLVRAVGRLRQRSRSTERAAAAIRTDARRLLALRYGLAPGTAANVIAEVTAARTALSAEQVLLAIDDRPIPDETALVALTRQIDMVRQEALSGRGG
jgi:hypothetical protein